MPATALITAGTRYGWTEDALIIALTVIVTAVVVFGCLFVWSAILNRSPESQLKQAIGDQDSLEELVQWSGQVIGGDVWPRGFSRTVPQKAKSAGLNEVYASRDDGGVVKWVVFEFGGADNHHGIIIGNSPPPSGVSWGVEVRWRDNVWYYEE